MTSPVRGAVGIQEKRLVDPPVQLTLDGVVCQRDVGVLSEQFSQRHSIRLPQLVHPDLMNVVLKQMEHASWALYDHGEIGRELLLDNAGVIAVLRFAVNTPEFLRVVELITGCGAISIFDGRVYRMVPRTDHRDSWHDDAAAEPRLVGMSVNLGPRPYRGGIFQLREKGSERILSELPNVVRGDAILFRISPALEHRVTPMEGAEPKTAFAGWFKPGVPDLFTQVRQLHGRLP